MKLGQGRIGRGPDKGRKTEDWKRMGVGGSDGGRGGFI